MELSEVKKGIYLYIACYNEESKKAKAFIAVTKAMLFDEVAIEMENLGDHAILFTSSMSLVDIKEKLKDNKTPYLLIDIGISYDIESIAGLLPNSDFEIVKNINKNFFSKNKPYLNNKMRDSVEGENFELAACLKKMDK